MTRSVNGPDAARRLALAIGAVYLVLGALGFFVPETPQQVGHDTTNLLWIFSVSVLLNLVHLLTGVLGLAAWRRRETAQFYGWVLFAAYAGLIAYGIPAAASGRGGDWLNLNWADNWLHLLTAVAGLAMGFLPRRRAGQATHSAD